MEDHDKTLSVTASSVQEPGIGQVQATVCALREASITVVEAIQAWRIAKAGSSHSGGIDGEDRAGRQSEVSATALDSRGQQPDGNVKLKITLVDTNEQSLLPSVSRRRSILAPDTHGNFRQEHLPTYIWRKSKAENTRESMILTLSSTISTCNPLSPSSGQYAGSRPGITGGEEVNEKDVNYLAKMAWDTDFIGLPGSMLIFFFPPDTKFFRNPFLLGNNLDDILVVFPKASPRIPNGCTQNWDGEPESPEHGGLAVASSRDPAGAQRGRGARMDTQQIRRVAAIIVAEVKTLPEVGIHKSVNERGEEAKTNGAGGGPKDACMAIQIPSAVLVPGT